MQFSDRYLSVWVFLAMCIGSLSGYLFPNLSQFIGELELSRINLLIFAVIHSLKTTATTIANKITDTLAQAKSPI